jgi:hypothetical protein
MMVYLKKDDIRDHASTPAFVSTQAVTSTQYCDVELVATMMSKLVSMAYHHRIVHTAPEQTNCRIVEDARISGVRRGAMLQKLCPLHVTPVSTCLYSQAPSTQSWKLSYQVRPRRMCGPSC